MAEPGGMAHTFVHHAIASSSASGPQVSVDTNTAHNWGSGYTMNQEPGSMQWFAFNPPPAYRTPESSLQHAITPPVANAAFHSTTNIVSDQPTGPPDQPGSVSTTTLQMSSSQPPANVQSLRSEPALFSTTPLPFSKPPDVASRSGSADPSKPVRAKLTLSCFHQAYAFSCRFHPEKEKLLRESKKNWQHKLLPLRKLLRHLQVHPRHVLNFHKDTM